MTPTAQRAQWLADASKHPDFARFIGEIEQDDLCTWLAAELGRVDALDCFSVFGNIRSKAYAPSHILHIVSGNTPHAAFQSLLRGLLLGSHNTVKTPSGGIKEFSNWILSLPPELGNTVTLIEDQEGIPWEVADTVIAIGSDATMHAIQSRLSPYQTFIPHGHKVSIGVVHSDYPQAAKLAAKDVSLYDQRGCLSLHAIYVSACGEGDAPEFARLLANEMAQFAKQSPPAPRTLSESGAIHNFRETTRFLTANSPDTEIWHSEDTQDWTVVYTTDPTLKLSCLGCCVSVIPMPQEMSGETLGSEAQHLSTIALHPFSNEQAEQLSHLAAHRICPLGESQRPSLFWHHDGLAPLASIVKWRDIG